jgi:hypothetical protein
MRNTVPALTLIMLTSPIALAQWTANPALNTPIATRPNDQVQPKIRVRSDGGSFVSWYDNATGGYDMHIQSLSATGAALGPANGWRVADFSFSSTQDYDLRIDASQNAVLCFRDDRSGTTRITLQRVAPDGTFLWGPGVTVAGGDNGNAPKCAVLSNGDLAVTWTTSSSPASWAMQVLDGAGAPRWANPIVVSEASRYMALSDIQAAEDGSLIVLWIRGTTANAITSAKHLYTQKFAANGSPLWTGTAGAVANAGTPVIVFNSSSVQNGYFPNFLPDGTGGAVYGWYEIGGSRNAYVQRISSTGSLAFPAPVASTGATAGRIRISASVAFDASDQTTYLAWTDSSSPTQNSWGIRAQKFAADGSRLWGDAGAELLPLNPNQSSFVRCTAHAGGLSVLGFDARGSTTGIVVAGRFDPSGAPAWIGQPIQACSVVSGKSRLDVAGTADGGALLVWGDARSDVNDIYAQRINLNGSLGAPRCPADLDDGTSTGTPDGGVGIEDLLYYLVLYDAGSVSADVDNGTGTGTPDGGVGIEDLLYYLTRFEAGC